MPVPVFATAGSEMCSFQVKDRASLACAPGTRNDCRGGQLEPVEQKDDELGWGELHPFRLRTAL
jgi:hypothetical protein